MLPLVLGTLALAGLAFSDPILIDGYHSSSNMTCSSYTSTNGYADTVVVPFFDEGCLTFDVQGRQSVNFAVNMSSLPPDVDHTVLFIFSNYEKLQLDDGSIIAPLFGMDQSLFTDDGEKQPTFEVTYDSEGGATEITIVDGGKLVGIPTVGGDRTIHLPNGGEAKATSFENLGEGIFTIKTARVTKARGVNEEASTDASCVLHNEDITSQVQVQLDDASSLQDCYQKVRSNYPRANGAEYDTSDQCWATFRSTFSQVSIRGSKSCIFAPTVFSGSSNVFPDIANSYASSTPTSLATSTPTPAVSQNALNAWSNVDGGGIRLDGSLMSAANVQLDLVAYNACGSPITGSLSVNFNTGQFSGERHSKFSVTAMVLADPETKVEIGKDYRAYLPNGYDAGLQIGIVDANADGYVKKKVIASIKTDDDSSVAYCDSTDEGDCKVKTTVSGTEVSEVDGFGNGVSSDSALLDVHLTLWKEVVKHTVPPFVVIKPPETVVTAPEPLFDTTELATITNATACSVVLHQNTTNGVNRILIIDGGKVPPGTTASVTSSPCSVAPTLGDVTIDGTTGEVTAIEITDEGSGCDYSSPEDFGIQFERKFKLVQISFTVKTHYDKNASEYFGNWTLSCSAGNNDVAEDANYTAELLGDFAFEVKYTRGSSEHPLTAFAWDETAAPTERLLRSVTITNSGSFTREEKHDLIKNCELKSSTAVYNIASDIKDGYADFQFASAEAGDYKKPIVQFIVDHEDGGLDCTIVRDCTNDATSVELSRVASYFRTKSKTVGGVSYPHISFTGINMTKELTISTGEVPSASAIVDPVTGKVSSIKVDVASSGYVAAPEISLIANEDVQLHEFIITDGGHGYPDEFPVYCDDQSPTLQWDPANETRDEFQVGTAYATDGIVTRIATNPDYTGSDCDADDSLYPMHPLGPGPLFLGARQMSLNECGEDAPDNVFGLITSVADVIVDLPYFGSPDLPRPDFEVVVVDNQVTQIKLKADSNPYFSNFLYEGEWWRFMEISVKDGDIAPDTRYYFAEFADMHGGLAVIPRLGVDYGEAKATISSGEIDSINVVRGGLDHFLPTELPITFTSSENDHELIFEYTGLTPDGSLDEATMKMVRFTQMAGGTLGGYDFKVTDNASEELFQIEEDSNEEYVLFEYTDEGNFIDGLLNLDVDFGSNRRGFSVDVSYDSGFFKMEYTDVLMSPDDKFVLPSTTGGFYGGVDKSAHDQNSLAAGLAGGFVAFTFRVDVVEYPRIFNQAAEPFTLISPTTTGVRVEDLDYARFRVCPEGKWNDMHLSFDANVDKEKVLIEIIDSDEEYNDGGQSTHGVDLTFVAQGLQDLDPTDVWQGSGHFQSNFGSGNEFLDIDPTKCIDIIVTTTCDDGPVTISNLTFKSSWSGECQTSADCTEDAKPQCGKALAKNEGQCFQCLDDCDCEPGQYCYEAGEFYGIYDEGGYHLSEEDAAKFRTCQSKDKFIGKPCTTEGNTDDCKEIAVFMKEGEDDIELAPPLWEGVCIGKTCRAGVMGHDKCSNNWEILDGFNYEAVDKTTQYSKGKMKEAAAKAKEEDDRQKLTEIDTDKINQETERTADILAATLFFVLLLVIISIVATLIISGRCTALTNTKKVTPSP